MKDGRVNTPEVRQANITSAIDQYKKDIETTKKVTENEMTVYKAIIEYCYDDCGAELKPLSARTKIEINSLRGVLGSLIKKGLVAITEDERPTASGFDWYDVDIYYSTFSENCWYMCDEFTQEEIQEFLKQVEVA